MTWVDLNWFHDAELLAKIGRGPLASVLDMLAPLLAQQNISLPNPSLPDDRYFADLAALCRSQPMKLVAYLPPFLAAASQPMRDLASSSPDPQKGAGASPPKRVPAEGSPEAGTQGGPEYVFRRTGRLWEVVFSGGRAFRLRNTLGARYLDYLLHEPNEPIRAFDLEVEVSPEKGEARVGDSIQPESDPQAMREYRQELGQLQGEREKAQAAGDREEVARLIGQIEALESALKESGSAADTGERARDNVRKAIGVVTEQLRDGGPEEKALAEHLRTHLSIGHECLYSQPQGRICD